MGYDFVLLISAGIDICLNYGISAAVILGSMFSGPSAGESVERLLIDGCLDNAFRSHRRAEQSVNFQSRGAEFQRWVVKSMMRLDPCDNIMRLIWPLTSYEPVPLYLRFVEKIVVDAILNVMLI